MKKIIATLCAIAITPLLHAQVTTPDRIDSLISKMSATQKVAQLTGKTLFAMADDEVLGIPGWLMSDGPHGVHLEGYTSFPTGIAMAALWNRQMWFRLGHAMGEEFWAAGQHVALAPCIDLCLDPRGGRTAESAGEDPYISAQIGVEVVRGIQQLPVMACLKHFEIEGKQAYRKTCDEQITERDLMGFFGLNFRTALQEGLPLSLMSSYNLVNGVQVAAHRHLLTDILRTRWGYPFPVISDWGAVKDGPASLIGGTDVCMGSVHYAQQLPTALSNGKITEANLDTAVARVLLSKYAMGCMNPQLAKPEASTLVDNDDHRALCREAAGKAVVLLRNENALLPLSNAAPLRIAVIGPNAAVGNLNCFGSSETTPAYAVSVIEGIRNVAPEADITFAQGCAISGDDTSAFAAAEAAAREADVVIFAGGLDRTLEGESIIGVLVQDRASTALPAIQQQLIRRLYAVNPRLVVVLQSGGIVSVSDCIDDIPALVYSFYSGQEAGNGIADVLFGKRNPAGRLPMTMPVSDSQLPEWNDTYFTDDWGAGYRWFQRKALKPQFAFGFGLSYTTFSYSNLRLSVDSAPAGTPITVSVDVTNTGTRNGEEVVQLYIGQTVPPQWQPLRQLHGFERVAIPAGATRTIDFKLTAEDFYEWNVETQRYEVPATNWDICVGPSSDDLPLKATLTLTDDIARPDLRLIHLFTQPRYPHVGDEVTFYAYVINQGTANADAWTLVVGSEEQPDMALAASFDVPQTPLPCHQTLMPGQGTIQFATLGSWTPETPGDITLHATLTPIGEQEEWDIDNNTLTTTLHIYGEGEGLADHIPGHDIAEVGHSRTASTDDIFDLSGRHVGILKGSANPRTTHLAPGLYLIRGRKVVIQ